MHDTVGQRVDKSKIFDGKISENFVSRLKVDKFLITKTNFINRKNYMKYKIFAFEIRVSKNCIFIQEKNPYFLQSSKTYTA